MTRALIVVDVQNDFADPRGRLYVQDGENTIWTINQLIHRARRCGEIIVFFADWHPKDLAHFCIWPVHCVAGEWGAEFHPDLAIPRGSLIVRKDTRKNENGYSGFDRTAWIGVIIAPQKLLSLGSLDSKVFDLNTVLRNMNVSEVVAVGLATDYCVKQTALEARRLGYVTQVVIDLCRTMDINPGNGGSRAIEEMKAAGVEMVTGADILAGRA